MTSSPIDPPTDSPRFPERARYGCVNCGSINHTTGDTDWCPVERERANEPPFDSQDVCAACDWDGWQHAPVCPIGGVRDDDPE